LTEIDNRNLDNRNLKDRRRKPTPTLSGYIFSGRRQGFRRQSDQEIGGYVDRYSPKLFFFFVLILGLNMLDAVFTMMILDSGGWEFNPIVSAIMNIHGYRFWIWKFAIVSFSLSLLCLHSKFRPVEQIIIALGLIYLLTVIYQVFIITRL
jgi:hypothetical protein